MLSEGGEQREREKEREEEMGPPILSLRLKTQWSPGGALVEVDQQ